MCSGVSPRRSAWFGSAPWASSRATAGAQQRCAASVSGEHFLRSSPGPASGLAPCSSSSLAIRCPWSPSTMQVCTARCRGLRPLQCSSHAWPSCRRSRNAGRCWWRTASCTKCVWAQAQWCPCCSDILSTAVSHVRTAWWSSSCFRLAMPAGAGGGVSFALRRWASGVASKDRVSCAARRPSARVFGVMQKRGTLGDLDRAFMALLPRSGVIGVADDAASHLALGSGVAGGPAGAGRRRGGGGSHCRRRRWRPRWTPAARRVPRAAGARAAATASSRLPTTSSGAGATRARRRTFGSLRNVLSAPRARRPWRGAAARTLSTSLPAGALTHLRSSRASCQARASRPWRPLGLTTVSRASSTGKEDGPTTRRAGAA
mmetsp:Transcript_25346/g.67026  ORF Transcript_25346/g.67026 Transcript_25346/m.67026 type:complete len:374 (+) Transcript_25346:517-1638(+)